MRIWRGCWGRQACAAESQRTLSLEVGYRTSLSAFTWGGLQKEPFCSHLGAAEVLQSNVPRQEATYENGSPHALSIGRGCGGLFLRLGSSSCCALSGAGCGKAAGCNSHWYGVTVRVEVRVRAAGCNSHRLVLAQPVATCAGCTLTSAPPRDRNRPQCACFWNTGRHETREARHQERHPERCRFGLKARAHWQGDR
eukprot:358863-Chlamydomonas_euryale.AAC.4